MNGKSCFADDISFHQAATFEIVKYVIHTIFFTESKCIINLFCPPTNVYLIRWADLTNFFEPSNVQVDEGLFQAKLILKAITQFLPTRDRNLIYRVNYLI